MQPVTRFAPSPTGRLHLGHAYSALLAHDFAREREGSFLLRIEDIDPGRVRSVFIDGIIEDLLWLGLEWDADMAYQSERLDLYAAALERLKEQGTTVVLVSHRPTLVQGVDKVLLLKDGALEMFGPRAEVLKRLMNPRPT